MRDSEISYSDIESNSGISQLQLFKTKLKTEHFSLLFGFPLTTVLFNPDLVS